MLTIALSEYVVIVKVNMTFKDWKYEGWDEAFKIVLIDYKTYRKKVF